MNMNLNATPEIAEIDKRIREKSKAVDLARESLSEEVQRKQARISLQKQEKELEAEREKRKQAVLRAKHEKFENEVRPEYRAAVEKFAADMEKVAKSNAVVRELEEQARALGHSLGPISWSELCEIGQSMMSKLPTWRKNVQKVLSTLPASKKKGRIRKVLETLPASKKGRTRKRLNKKKS